MSECEACQISRAGGRWAGAPQSRCKIIRHDNRLIAAHIKNSSCLQMVIWGVIWDALNQTKTLNLGKRTGRCGAGAKQCVVLRESCDALLTRTNARSSRPKAGLAGRATNDLVHDQPSARRSGRIQGRDHRDRDTGGSGPVNSPGNRETTPPKVRCAGAWVTERGVSSGPGRARAGHGRVGQGSRAAEAG